MSGDAPLRTPLHAWHAAHGGRMVEFAGWSMPVQYTTITDEHRAVRSRVGLFDISHMGRLLFEGPDALPWLEHATTNQVARLSPGQIQYSLMVGNEGGVLDDVLVYRLPEGGFALVCNASNRAKVVEQFERLHAGYHASLRDLTLVSVMIAVQGPRARETISRVVSAPFDTLAYYHVAHGTALGANVSVSRTGYTGEDGYEAIVARDLAVRFWEALLEAGREFGVVPCGLGARDTLRLEAAMPLYGHELDETIDPYSAGLGWAVKLNKGGFVGREALRARKADPGRARIGLALSGKRIARQGATVLRDGHAIGAVTSGTFSPTFERGLAMALVATPPPAVGEHLSVDVRGQEVPAEVVALPFYRRSTPERTEDA